MRELIGGPSFTPPPLLEEAGIAQLFDDPVVNKVRRLHETCLWVCRNGKRRLNPRFGHKRGHLPPRREGVVILYIHLLIRHLGIFCDDLLGSPRMFPRKPHAFAASLEETNQRIAVRTEVAPPSDERGLGEA